MVKPGERVPEYVKRAAGLSDYAVETRYPGLAEPVTWEEYEEAVAIAEVVVHYYDYFMSAIFFDELGIPKPDYNPEVGLDSYEWQTREMPNRIAEGEY